jgi:hypothetical protein
LLERAQTLPALRCGRAGARLPLDLADADERNDAQDGADEDQPDNNQEQEKPEDFFAMHDGGSRCGAI